MKYVLFALSLCCFIGYAQDPLRFNEEVISIQKKYDTIWKNSIETIVFTGSSSIRFWLNLQELYPEYQIVNTGFGGALTSDLLYYMDELILAYHPKKVFIYAGDNDIYLERETKEIIGDTKKIIDRIKKQDGTTQIVLISAKPSLARWGLKKDYKQLNRRFKRLSKKDKKIYYADIWGAMLDKRKVREDIFIEDGLHLNRKGYNLWYTIINNYIRHK